MAEYKITCPHCQETLVILGTQLNQVVSCYTCGRDLRAPSLPELARQSGGSKQCPFCSESIRSAAIKCKHCGEFLSDRPIISSPQKNRKASLKGSWLLLLVGFALQVLDRSHQMTRDPTEDPFLLNRNPTLYDELGLIFFIFATIAATGAIFKGRVGGGWSVLILSLLFLAAGLHKMGVI